MGTIVDQAEGQHLRADACATEAKNSFGLQGMILNTIPEMIYNAAQSLSVVGGKQIIFSSLSFFFLDLPVDNPTVNRHAAIDHYTKGGCFSEHAYGNSSGQPRVEMPVSTSLKWDLNDACLKGRIFGDNGAHKDFTDNDKDFQKIFF